MKHCPKTDEPRGLKQYRTDNQASTWNDFRNECQSGLNEVYQTLEHDQGGLCAYCEMKIQKDNRQVEHFHDKSDNSDQQMPNRWHLDWQNMWFACKGGSFDTARPDEYAEPRKLNLSCGSKKEMGGNKVYLDILAPDQIPAFPRLFQYQRVDGEDEMWIFPDKHKCQEAGIDIKRVQDTIDLLGLNCIRLRKARFSAMKPVVEHLAKLITELGPTIDGREKIKSLAKSFLKDHESSGRYSFFTMFRFRFDKIAEEFLQSIQYNG